MIDTLRVFLVASALVLGLSACHETIHIHPKPQAEEKAVLTLCVDNSAPQLGALIDYTVSPPVIIYSDDLPEKTLAHARGARTEADEALMQRARSLSDAFDEVAPYLLDGDKWKLHLKYEIYAGTAEQVAKGLVAPFHNGDISYRADISLPEYDVEVELPFGTVTVLAVAHIVPVSTDGDWFFNTTSLNNLISDKDRRQGEHDNVYRDCFVVGQEYHIEPTGIDGNVQHITATLVRPQGRYMVLADDYETYLDVAVTDIGDVVSNIYYPSYINVAYSVLSGLPVASSYGFGYDYKPTVISADASPYVRLGDDWSFVNGDRSNFNINIAVADKNDGHVVNYNQNVLVPVFPGRVTFVVGHWLTDVSEGGGGVSIDPNFTDEIVIHF